MIRWWRDRAFWIGFASIWDLSGQRTARELNRLAAERRREPTPAPLLDLRRLHEALDSIEVTKDELDGGYVAECKALPGCMSQGETVEDAVNNLADAIGAVLLTGRR